MTQPGRVAVVTGAAGGIGLAAAQRRLALLTLGRVGRIQGPPPSVDRPSGAG